MWQFLKHFLDDVKTDLYHSSLLISGNVVTQIIVVLAYPVLTRLYTATQFGEFSLFLSITGILTIISTARLEYALMLPNNDIEVRNLMKIGLRWCLIFSLSCFVLSLMLSQFGPNALIIPGIYWIGLYVFLSGTTQIFVIYRNRQQQYKTLAKINILQNTASSGIKVLLGFTKVISHGLIWGNIIGQLIATLTATKGYIKQIIYGKPNAVKATLQKYSAFPKYRTMQAVINSLSSNLPIFFITYYFSAKEAGYFALVVGIGYRVIVLISQTLYQVLFQKFSSLYRNEEPMLPIFSKFTVLLFVASFVPCVFIFIFATPMVKLFFGNDWIEAGTYIRLVLPWLILVFMTSPFAFMADIFSLQKKVLLIDILHLIARVLALTIGFLFNNVLLSVLLFSITSISFLLAILIWFYFIIKNAHHKYKLV
jgi:lipopolysaccharide exporter